MNPENNRAKTPENEQRPAAKKRSDTATILFSLVLFGGALMILTAASGWLGYKSGERERNQVVTVTMDAYLAEQFSQAVDDIALDNFVLARERLIYILSVKPDYQPAIDLLVDVEVALNLSSEPTPVPFTPTPSPTPDLRPAKDQLQSIIHMVAAAEWDLALEMIANLRANEPGFARVKLDGLIYICLRNRGVGKILSGDLEGGIYDFTLAEQFAPLDAETENYRNWARLYLLGNAFWGAYPEQAANYYGQLVAAAPNLTDISGVSAFYRYWASLLQIADNLAKEEEWCDASSQMVHVIGVWDQAYVYPTATWVYNRCLALTPSATPTYTITITGAATSTPTGGAIPSDTPVGPSNTPEPSTNTPTQTATPTATSGS